MVAGGYIAKGNSCCERAVMPKELIEDWVVEQMGKIVREHLADKEGQGKLRRLIAQELAGTSRFDGSELAALPQHRADIEASMDNLLDNLTPTNREYVDRRIEKLREELVKLEGQELALREQQDREKQAELIAERAFAVAKDFERLAEAGTVEEKRSLIRAFLPGIDFDPRSSTGKAHFWILPTGGPGDGGRPRYEPPTAISAQKGSESQQEGMSSFAYASRDTRYERKRERAPEGASSFQMVAGGGFEPPTSGL